MIEISYWNIRGVINPHLGININIIFKSKYNLEMGGLSIINLGRLKKPVRYCINLVISDKRFKYITKRIVLTELEGLLQEGRFLAWGLSVDKIDKNESLLYQLFEYPEKIKTDTLEIKDGIINDMINKKKL